MASQGAMSTALGSVNAFEPVGYQVQVLLQAETPDSPASSTGWIPLASPWTGNGWGLFAPASPGDLILVFFQDGSLQNPVAGMRLFYDEQLPTAVQAGELWMVHKSGSALKFSNDGTVTLNSNTKMQISSDTEIDLTAPIVTINAASSCNILSPVVNAGVTGGPFETVLNNMSIPTVNFKAS